MTWELVGRIAVTLGVAGIVGALGRLAHLWLRAFYKWRSR
jgi:hypothetical protein